MKTRKHTVAFGRSVLLMTSVFVLGACSQDTAWMKEKGWPVEDWNSAYVEKRPQVSAVNYDIDIGFSAVGETLKDGEATRLAGWLGNVTPGYGDQVLLTAAEDRLGVRRLEAVKSIFAGQGIRAFAVKPGSGITLPEGDAVRITVRRYVANLPACPDWSGNPAHTFSNQPHSNFGCATASNLGMMVANPRDLVLGTPEGPADAEVVARAVRNYRAGAAKEIATINAGAFEKSSSSGN